MPDNMISRVEDYKHLSNKETADCLQKEPLAKLGTGEASLLNYNLPQSTCFSVKSYIRVPIPKDYFTTAAQNAPAQHFWNSIAELTSTEIDSLLTVGKQIDSKYATKEFNTLIKSGTTAAPVEEAPETESTETETINTANQILNKSTSEIAQQVNKGYRPYSTRNFYGKEIVKYAKEPSRVQPTIALVEHYKVCSYLGDYGAGKTLKTFSLLPGEQTEISIKTYKHKESTSAKSENILDSFTENSTDELENLLQTEEQTQSTYGETSQTEFGADISLSFGGELNLGFEKLKNSLKLEADLEANADFRQTNTTNSSRTNNINSLNRAMNKHVANTSAVREVSVNTEISETEKTGEELSITRTLENINKSRVLNFVFRQLLQEYFTITYLDDISIVYSNGYPESRRVVKLDNLEGLLSEVISDTTKANEIRDNILNELSSVYDYEGTRQRFVERETYDIVDIDDNVVSQQQYFRKKKDLSQTYNGKTVSGIILDVQHRILKTDSVIVDALLGQGEALDCFNVKLQASANMKAFLENINTYLEQEKTNQAMGILDAIQDPVQRAELYQKVMGECCASNIVVPLGTEEEQNA